MTTIYQIKIDNTDAGISSDFGLAIARAYHAALDLGLISEIGEYPTSLCDSPFEGNEVDLMARALDSVGSDIAITIVKHDIEIEPTTNSDMGPAPYGREGSISWALQQTIYDVAAGSDSQKARTLLFDLCKTLTSSVGRSATEQQIFFWDQREVGGHIGKNFRDSLFPIPIADMRESIKTTIEMMPYMAIDIFDRAALAIANNLADDRLPKR
jgi:hypothetical protein